MKEDKKPKKKSDKPKPWYLGFGFLKAAAKKLQEQRAQTDKNIADAKK